MRRGRDGRRLQRPRPVRAPAGGPGGAAQPLALLHPESVSDPEARATIEALTGGYPDRGEYFVERLAEGVGTIAAAFHPREVIVRLSDFKSNEYAGLVGGRDFEPAEENPMLGFRGAFRYYHPRYREAFALECRAMRRVREAMGLTNVKLMIPFCRTLEEGRRVLAELARHGLERGRAGLEVYMMCEIPSNVLLAREFAGLFDGFSIGSNDLTQLVLGVDRDSELVAPLFDERDPAVLAMVGQVIEDARKAGVKIGICGQAPSDYPEFTRFLVSQALAVTGSVNQQGEIQPVGAINEKVEGFFDVCRARGLTGGEGVLIPEANARHLMLREDVVEAVRDERFHVHAVSTVDEGLELLSGRPAGARGADGRFPDGSVNAAVEQALEQNIERLRQLRAGGFRESKPGKGSG